MKKLLFVLAASLLVTGSALAFDTTCFQIGVWAPKVQIVPDTIDISGLKLNLPYGGNNNVTGLDLGFFSINDNTNAILQLNLFNRTDEDFLGFQVGLINLSGNSTGLNVGLLNSAESMSSGLTIGLVNTALEHRGVQIGLVNYTEFLTGFQIGIANIVTKSTVPFFPIINFCF